VPSGSGLGSGFGSQIQIGMMMVKFAHQDLTEEIAVDEDERAGRSSHSKLNFD
jgi:hypothetical protein